MINSADFRMRNFRKLCKYTDKDLSLLIYKQLVLPAFEYCDFVLDGGPELLGNEIQVIQNHCLRACLGIRDPRDITRVELHVQCECKKKGLQER